MKSLLIGLLTASMLLTGTNALAWGRHSGHYAPSVHHRYYGHHHHSHGYRGAYLLGGLALGAVLTDALIHRDPAVVYVEPSPRPRVIYRERPVTRVVVTPPERRLLRDLDGNCYEVGKDGSGTELRTQLPASKCDW